MSKIIVIGSINLDFTMYMDALPSGGHTKIANGFLSNIGGKGANQACASLFLGGDVTFIGAVGNDSNGKYIVEQLKAKGLSLRIKKYSNVPTGSAFIVVEESTGENRIMVNPGANNALDTAYIDKNSDLFQPENILLLQQECQPSLIEHAIVKAKENDMFVILNPAPIKKLSDNIYHCVDIIVPNEHELYELTGEKDIFKACNILLDKGVANVLVTLGENGSLFVNKSKQIQVSALKNIDVVDTTAAGDSYLGAFVTKLAENTPIKEAMEFASKASGYTVTKKGAIIALPHIEDLK